MQKLWAASSTVRSTFSLTTRWRSSWWIKDRRPLKGSLRSSLAARSMEERIVLATDKAFGTGARVPFPPEQRLVIEPSNRPVSYCRCWIGTRLQWRLVQGNIFIKTFLFYFILSIFLADQCKGERRRQATQPLLKHQPMKYWTLNQGQTTTPGTPCSTLYEKHVGSLTSPASHVTLKVQEKGPTVYSPCTRRLKPWPNGVASRRIKLLVRIW